MNSSRAFKYDREIRIMHRYVMMNDFDGTVLDTMERHGWLAADCMNQYFGMPASEAEELYHQTTGVPFDEQLRVIIPDGDVELLQQCASAYHRQKAEKVYRDAQLFCDVRDGLAQLSEMQYPLVVNTSTETPVTAKLLEKNNVLPYFTAIWGREYGSKSANIQEAKRLWAPEQILFIGDSANDMQLGKIDGVTTIGRTGEGKGFLTPQELAEEGATYVIRGFDEIPGIIDDREAG